MAGVRGLGKPGEGGSYPRSVLSQHAPPSMQIDGGFFSFAERQEIRRLWVDLQVARLGYHFASIDAVGLPGLLRKQAE